MKKLSPRALLLIFFGCGARPPADATAQREYPCVLHPPSELAPDFVVEQHVEASKDGHSGSFDAVVQKRGDELLVVGLGPMGIRAFVLRQRGTELTAEQRIGPAPPFPPRNVIIDVHRVFFKRLAGGAPDGVRTGELDDEDVVEVWRGGELVERRFSRPGFAGAVKIAFGPGCRADRCEPVNVHLVNEWFGYELRIDNRRFHAID